MSRRSIPCAIYTRKSTDEGLDQAFNSLDAQRAACSAYIRSQAGEGWIEIETCYDDGAQSGGTLDRPALQRLLADVAAGRVKVVVVYKVDRLTRSLADFAKIIEVLEANEASFVSITQQFSTTTSMGRLTLNVLLSFAQFEREVTAERIRDKIAASKKKGMWMGGVVPLGYDIRDRKLVVNGSEAETVRTIFELYREYGSILAVKEEADKLDLRTKVRIRADGTRQGGYLFSQGHINKLLINRLYLGEVHYKETSYPGEHQGIIGHDLWDAVQAQLARNAITRRTRSNADAPSLLTGLVETGEGSRLTPSHCVKRGQRYRYYITKQRDRGGWRLPALPLEKAIIDGICCFLINQERLSAELASDSPPSILQPLFKRAAALADGLRGLAPASQREVLLHILQRAVITESNITIVLSASALRERLGLPKFDEDEAVQISIPVSIRRRGVETRLVIENSSEPAKPDTKLVSLVIQAHRWFADIKARPNVGLHDLGKQYGADPSDISRILPLAFLAPDIVEAILDGSQPPELTAARLKRMRDLPLNWQQQRRYLGFR